MFSSKEVIKEVKLNQLEMLNLDKDASPLQFSLTMISQRKGGVSVPGTPP